MSEIIPYLLSNYVSRITGFIHAKYGFDEPTALRKFLYSQTCAMLDNPQMEMWEFSAEVIFELWETEQITGDPRNSLYIKGE